MKKILKLFMAFIMLLSMFGCANVEKQMEEVLQGIWKVVKTPSSSSYEEWSEENGICTFFVFGEGHKVEIENYVMGELTSGKATWSVENKEVIMKITKNIDDLGLPSNAELLELNEDKDVITWFNFELEKVSEEKYEAAIEKSKSYTPPIEFYSEAPQIPTLDSVDPNLTFVLKNYNDDDIFGGQSYYYQAKGGNPSTEFKKYISELSGFSLFTANYEGMTAIAQGSKIYAIIMVSGDYVYIQLLEKPIKY